MFAQAKQLTGWWLPVAILATGLAWIALDRAVWPWDQAWFGAHTVTLWETLRHQPLEWTVALVHATPLKPPAVAWFGQLFVPLGSALGSVDAGLRLSVWVTSLAALAVTFRALLELSGRRALVAAAGTLLTGAAPLFVALTTQFLAEASQTLAVAWFLLIMARAPGWSRSRLGAHLVAAASFAILSKTTSPLFCAGPALVALAELSKRRRPPPVPDSHRASWGWWAFAALLAFAAAAWYGRNHELAALHARTAAFGPVAELYGEREPFLRGLADWLRMAYRVAFLPPVALLVGALAGLGVARRLTPPLVRPGAHDGRSGVALLQILLTLSLFSLSPVREPRYLMPLLPLAAAVVCWAIVRTGDWAAWLLIGALGIQLALVQSQALGLWSTRPTAWKASVLVINPALHVLDPDPGPAADLAAIARRTCAPGGPAVHNFVGVDLLHLSGHALTYAAAKERLAGRSGDCRYDSIGFGTVEAGEAQVNSQPYVYWITVDPDVRPIPAYHAFLNQSAPVVFRRLRRRGVLEREPWDGPPGIRLFRFVRR